MFRQGDIGTQFYTVLSGTLDVYTSETGQRQVSGKSPVVSLLFPALRPPFCVSEGLGRGERHEERAGKETFPYNSSCALHPDQNKDASGTWLEIKIFRLGGLLSLFRSYENAPENISYCLLTVYICILSQ